MDGTDLQYENQNLQSISTDAGILIVVKPLHAHVNSSIRCNFESDLNVTDASDVQLEQQSLRTIWILDSITTPVDLPK
jgi:hypothetical protein